MKKPGAGSRTECVESLTELTLQFGGAHFPEVPRRTPAYA